jgi:hypothetical protein
MCCFAVVRHACALSRLAVDGLKLGQAVGGGPALQSYNCKPSDELAQLVSCDRTQMRNRGYDYTALSTVMHDESGAAVLLKIKVAPVLMTKTDAQKEIDQPSVELGGG